MATTQNEKPQVAASGIECSMQEVKAGKLYEAKDLDDLFEQLSN